MSKIVKTKRTKRFSNPEYQRVQFNSFSFGKSLKSYNNKELLFTNYVNSEKNENYLRLKKIFEKFNKNDYSFLTESFLELDEVIYTYKTADRLLDIINKGYGRFYTKKDLKRIYKIKNKENKKFQLFLDVNNNNATVILIDLFHLAISADITKSNGIVIKTDLNKLYNKQSNNKWNISNISGNK